MKRWERLSLYSPREKNAESQRERQMIVKRRGEHKDGVRARQEVSTTLLKPGLSTRRKPGLEIRGCRKEKKARRKPIVKFGERREPSRILPRTTGKNRKKESRIEERPRKTGHNAVVPYLTMKMEIA